jgi:hypothetical protein
MSTRTYFKCANSSCSQKILDCARHATHLGKAISGTLHLPITTETTSVEAVIRKSLHILWPINFGRASMYTACIYEHTGEVCRFGKKV